MYAAHNLKQVEDREERLWECLEGQGPLPDAPLTVDYILEYVQSALFDPIGLVEVMESDPRVEGAVLELVNSSTVGLPVLANDILDACSLLSTEMVCLLGIAASSYLQFEDAAEDVGLSPMQLLRDGCRTATLASQLGNDEEEGVYAFFAALLRDIGQVALAAQAPQVIGPAIKEARSRNVPLHIVERDMDEVHHTEAGAYLLASWRMPDPVVEAVLWHHHAYGREANGFGAVDAVYASDSLLASHGRRVRPAEPRVVGMVSFPPGYLAKAGVDGLLPRWRALAKAAWQRSLQD